MTLSGFTALRAYAISGRSLPLALAVLVLAISSSAIDMVRTFQIWI